MEADQRLQFLFTKYLEGACTEAEWEELRGLINGIDEQDAAALTPGLWTLWEKARQGELPSTAHLIDKEKMYAAVIRDNRQDREEGQTGEGQTEGRQKAEGQSGGNYTGEEEEVHTHPGQLRPTRLWKRIGWAAAAILIGLLILSRTLYHTGSSPIAGNTKTILPDQVKPGSNKATLTLDNGQQVELDSAGKGVLTRQGNSKIVKDGNGRLSYRKDGTEPSGTTIPYNRISTARANQYQLVLADGTKVWLNASSSLRFPVAFEGRERTVEMTGEAYFEIAQDAARPFHVKVDGTDIEALGTEFNINAYRDEALLKTSLLEGAVKITASGKSGKLVPGQEASLHPGGTLTIEQGNVALAAAWKNGYFQFDKAPLPAVMRQIGRWYDLDIEYTGPVPDRMFKGKIQRSLPLSGILHLLQKGGVHFTIEGRVLKVTG